MVEKYFEEYALLGQDILGSPEKWDKVLALIPEDILPSQSCLVSGGRACEGLMWGENVGLKIGVKTGLKHGVKIGLKHEVKTWGQWCPEV